ncbi:MAG: ABC transporter ATP-binding protein [Deltaproteobacteria bacterium]|nr:ABC transporter ATP-binding protein [Deltaproteobacteria bacterium]
MGESGCGKSSLGRAMLGLVPAVFDEGRLFGTDLAAATRPTWKTLRRRAQMVFQDVGGALSPRMRIGDAVTEPLVVHGLLNGRASRADEATKLLGEVGLDADLARRFPHELSGGQRQRALIARALASAPDLLIADEPIASLDISVQTQILELLDRERRDRSLAMVLISHDIRAVAAVCASVLVMYAGVAVEEGPADEVFAQPAHPYTKFLCDSIPLLTPRAEDATATEADASWPGTGCPFAPRCHAAGEDCAAALPAWRKTGDGRRCRCVRPLA